ncbi:redoxin domain-containing protein [Sphingobacterium alkalisoli]|uniref:Redoxin domain-containing protein n=1 Tax=Sphingobacterium alkalisoli TaxID=1874115 RepID=A0A4U0H3S8_9SPHI|nr:TlpA disulfide reductase family protein [Sphingobacterium alkalisoli]TJY65814.1 redoxin domain-containing protein [Sphingobacterium alkalisoli]GGH18158.1 hypothetical protein GCM10011418_21610 [Sphingobacterium alkalisoli]
MRKLRKGERYALWRDLANTFNKVKRLPRHCVPRNDEYKKSIMPSNGRSLLRCAHRDDGESGRSEQVKFDLSKSYRPFKAIYKGNYNSSRTLFSLLMVWFVVLFSDAQAQSAGERAADGLNKIKPLEIGDRVPEELWESTVEIQFTDGRKQSLRLDELCGKLILIDFWASWCASCIEGFPKMEKIQQKYGDDVAVLLVNTVQNRDTEERVNKLFSGYSVKHGYSLSLPYILQDSVFQTMFPHNTIPHIVWINKDGVLIANSYPSALTSKNIEAVLTGGSAVIHQKKLQEVTDRPVKLINEGNIVSGSFFTTHQEGYKAHGGKIYEDNNQTIYQVINMSLLRALSSLFRPEINGLPSRQWVFDTTEGAEWKHDILLNRGYDKMFCYHGVHNKNVGMEEARAVYKQDFRRVFDINVARRDTIHDVFEVHFNDNIQRIKTKGGIRQAMVDSAEEPVVFQNIDLDFVINHLSVYFDKPLILDTAYRASVDIVIPPDFFDYTLGAKLEFLSARGVDLMPVTRRTEVVHFYKSSGKEGEAI